MRGFQHCSTGFSKRSQSVLARSACRRSPKTTCAILRIGQHVTTLDRHMVHAAPCNSVNRQGDPEPLVNVRQMPRHIVAFALASCESVPQCLRDGRKLKDPGTDRTSAWMNGCINWGRNKQTNECVNVWTRPFAECAICWHKLLVLSHFELLNSSGFQSHFVQSGGH